MDAIDLDSLITKENFEIHPDGTTYTGQMKVIRKGTGDIITDFSKSGSTATDLFFIPHGKGTLHWPDGASYTGDIRDGKANG